MSDKGPTLSPLLVDRTIELKHCRIFYQQSRSQANLTPILFLHGWGISTEPYREILELTAQQHSVIAPDLPSFARSPYPYLIADYEGYARFLLEFLEALNLQQVHLVGHSLGGGIAIQLATLAPKNVKSLLLVDSTGLPSASIPEMIPRRALEMTTQLSPTKFYLQFIDIPQVFTRNLFFNTGNVIQTLLLSLHGNLRPLLPQIQAPCLLVWSQQDLTTPLDLAQEMVALIPNAELMTVEEGRHEWGLWNPEKFTSIMLDFVHQIDRAEHQPIMPTLS